MLVFNFDSDKDKTTSKIGYNFMSLHLRKLVTI